MAKKRKKVYKTIQATDKTQEELRNIRAITRIPMSALVEIAIPMLKEKYGIEE